LKIACWLKQAREAKTRSWESNSTWIKGNWANCFCNRPQKLSAETDQRTEALEGEVEKIEGQLAQHVAGLGQARHALGLSLAQVQASIPNDGALIEYLRYGHYLGKGEWEQRYGAVVLSAATPPHWIPLGGAKEIEAALNRYDDLVRGARDDDEMAAILQKLYREVWDPIAQAFPANLNRVIISPDGQLNFLSFATLLDGDKRFIEEKYSIQYMASGRDLLHQAGGSLNTKVALFANPDFYAKSPRKPSGQRGTQIKDLEGLDFDPLPGTIAESETLVEMFKGWHWGVTVLTGKDATKAKLFQLPSPPYILHLATHGFFAKADPAEAGSAARSFFRLEQDLKKSQFFKNPMNLTGIALTGAQATLEAWERGDPPDRDDDVIVTAEDVSTLDLQGTWLVTLSACDTGSGEARAGEGVMGLRRGFIQAGARNLLMTLWPISDEVTVQIMSDFYDAAHNSGNAPEALAEVQRNWLVKLRTEKGLAQAVNLAGPFIMSSQGKP
jgi:CHAT domain-containing protein